MTLFLENPLANTEKILSQQQPRIEGILFQVKKKATPEAFLFNLPSFSRILVSFAASIQKRSICIFSEWKFLNLWPASYPQFYR